MSSFEQSGQIVHNQTNIVNEAAPSSPPPSNLHQISPPTSDFVGREEEVRELLAAFDGGAERGAVISGLRGMGGVGKTELAKLVAKRVKGRFPDGQIMFNLRGARDDESLKPATAAEALQYVIRAFHPEARLPEDVDSLRGLYHSVLMGKQVLLLMDNALDARQLAPLVPPPDGCAMIVTSRHAIALAGMKPIPLDMLPPDKSRELLIEVCPRIEDEADVLAERCGYLPLALRLAASSLARHLTLAVHDYIVRVTDEHERIAELDKDREMIGVDRGITATLAASYNLLDGDMQRHWRLLGVFPVDFDVRAAASVWNMDERIAEEALGDLVAASTVQWDLTSSRYRLHDLARDYVRGQLNDDERLSAAQRHAAHYLAVLRRAEQLYLNGGDAILQGLAMFDREWPNVRAGQTWAALQRDTDVIAATLCKDYPNAGIHCLDLRIHPRVCIGSLNAAVIAARQLNDRPAEAEHLSNLGVAYTALGEPRKSIEYHEHALAIDREIGDRRGEGAHLGKLGLAYARLGETAIAKEFYEQYLAISREIGDRRGEGSALINLGCAYADMGAPRTAIGFYEQALLIDHEIGDRRGEGSAVDNLGRAYVDLGEPRKAIGFYEQALLIHREIGDRRGEGSALGNLGYAYSQLGDAAKAIDFHTQQFVIAREIGNRHGEGNARHNLACALHSAGRSDEASSHAEQALAIFEQIESPDAADARALLDQLQQLPPPETESGATV